MKTDNQVACRLVSTEKVAGTFPGTVPATFSADQVGDEAGGERSEKDAVPEVASRVDD
jgi:hypothetical protein